MNDDGRPMESDGRVFNTAAEFVAGLEFAVSFADGPGGRRAALGCGPDVWEAIAALDDNGGELPATADYPQMPLPSVEEGVRYYDAHPDESDAAIWANREAPLGQGCRGRSRTLVFDEEKSQRHGRPGRAGC